MSRAALVVLLAVAVLVVAIVSRGVPIGARESLAAGPVRMPRDLAAPVAGGATGAADYDRARGSALLSAKAKRAYEDRAAPSYWAREFRRRWRVERRAGRARARTIRVLRARLRATARPPYGNHPIEAAFLCIHSFEGRWNDPAAPYYGGLQMDRDFQLAYGRPYVERFGWADRWPVSVQLAVAIRGWLDRGFQPWPNTRRSCGL